MEEHDEEVIDVSQDEFFSEARTSGREAAVELPTGGYRAYVLDADDPVVAQYRGQRWDVYSAERTAPSFVQELLADWRSDYETPFRGITTDGHVLPGRYALPSAVPGPAASGRDPVAAARRLLERLSPDDRAAVSHRFDAPEWRAWSNPEFVVHRVGLRLEDVDEPTYRAVLDVLRASLSAEGYDRLIEAMSLNGYLGDLVELPTVMNDRSYWFALFGDPSTGDPSTGDPSTDGPWGWLVFGHHVAVAFAEVGPRHVIGPVFLGAEPADTNGDRPDLLGVREELARRLGASFTPEQAAAAVVYRSVLDPAMPAGRLHPADERHVAGAFQDNRVVPYEGIRAAELDEQQRRIVRDLVEDSMLLYRPEQRAFALADHDANIADTWVSWYGATDGSEPFYLRVQSPVVLTELDHHAGVWLGNQEPALFHVHSTFRHPNGGDYGRALAERLDARRRGLTDRDVRYSVGGTDMLGYFAAPDDGDDRPALLLVHDAFGCDENTRALARRYAAEGYAVLAADVWGNRATPTRGEDIGPAIGGMVADRDEWGRRVEAAFAALRAEHDTATGPGGADTATGPGGTDTATSPGRIGVVGYCFGGASALEYLRRGGEVDALVSVHGGLDLVGDDWAARPTTSGAAVLICTGADDPMATPDRLAAVEAGLTAVGARWEADVYSDTVHAFTSRYAGLGGPPHVVAYDPESAARAWRRTLDFLDAELHGPGRRPAPTTTRTGATA